MKKLEKLSLKQMKNEMPLMEKGAQKNLFGGYDDDCFWRCVSYIEGGSGTESAAETLADDYYYNGVCGSGSASDYYNTFSAGMNQLDIQDYKLFRMYQNSYQDNPTAYIGLFNIADGVGNYDPSTGGKQAVVITCVEENGSKD